MPVRAAPIFDPLHYHMWIWALNSYTTMNTTRSANESDCCFHINVFETANLKLGGNRLGAVSV